MTTEITEVAWPAVDCWIKKVFKLCAQLRQQSLQEQLHKAGSQHRHIARIYDELHAALLR